MKITIERSVLEQALDALESIATSSETRDMVNAAIVALREALAQPERCELCNYQHGHQIGCENNPVDIALNAQPAAQPKGRFAGLREALAQPAAQPTEPAGEPVAHFGSAYVNENGVHITTVLGPVAIPQDAALYTRPAVPLTDERERLCAAIKAADDKASEHDYMLDSDDCIKVIRGTWNPQWDKIGGAG
jgi:hypothetical protein